MRPSRSPAPSLVPLLMTSLLLAAGCGPQASEPVASPADEAAAVEVLNVYEERGDQPSGIFTAVAFHDGKLLAGTEDGLDVFEWSAEEGFTPLKRFDLRSNPLSSTAVHHIRPTEGGTAWISSTDGIARFQEGAVNLKEQSGPAKDAVAFQGDLVWIARSRSLDSYQPLSSKLSPVPLQIQSSDEGSNLPQAKQPLSLCPTGGPDIWVGTQFGLLRGSYEGGSVRWSHYYGDWDRVSGNSIQPVEGNSPLPGNRIYNLKQSPDGKQLAVCTDGGLAVFDLPDPRTSTNWVGMHRVNRSDPMRGGLYHEEIPGNVDMPSSDIHDVAFGEKALYLATPEGLAIVPREGPDKGKAKVIAIGEGLPSAKVTSLWLDRSRGVLFVATRFGLAALKI